jgi:isoquinoline 1-oxidoreductase beta subunit
MHISNPLKIENVSRRSMLKGLGITGALVLAIPAPISRAVAAYSTGAGAMPHGVVIDPKIFVSIAADGTVTIVAHRSEMGTGVRTSLPLVVAEELEADWSRVHVAQAPGNEEKYGNQDTDGSRSTRHYLMPMRQMGAMARTMLEEAAAKRWNVPVSEVKAVNHEVVHTPSGRKLGFGELAADAAQQPVPSADSVRLKDPKDFRYLGKGKVGIVDLRGITTGTAQYGADVRLPGMKYAVIARPPVVGGKLVSFDPKGAMAVPGVEKVMEVQGWPWPSKFQPLGGVAVIARNTGAAIKGRDALKVTWDDGPNANYDSVAYRADLEKAARAPGLVVRNDGDAEAALKTADKVIVGEYYMPHFAHVSMEPPVATARVADGKAEIWAPVQSPGGTREDVAKTLGIPVENVTVNVTLLGGAFGRKSKCDYALEAALLSKALGAPVRVQWTREDDIHHDFLHTVSVERIEAGLDKSGKVIAWRHRSVAPRSFPPSPRTRCTRRPLNSGWAWSTTHSTSRTCAARTRKRRPTPASAGSARCPTSRAPSPCSRWSANSPTPPAATRRTCCSS